MVAYLQRRHYRPANRPLRACHPRDLLDQVTALCRYRGIEPVITRELLDAACQSYLRRRRRSDQTREHPSHRAHRRGRVARSQLARSTPARPMKLIDDRTDTVVAEVVELALTRRDRRWIAGPRLPRRRRGDAHLAVLSRPHRRHAISHRRRVHRSRRSRGLTCVTGSGPGGRGRDPCPCRDRARRRDGSRQCGVEVGDRLYLSPQVDAC